MLKFLCGSFICPYFVWKNTAEYALFKDEIMIGHVNCIQAKTNTIMGVFIDNPFRNKGYGTILMQNIIKVAKQRKLYMLRLQVSPCNDIAIKLYKKVGFTFEPNSTGRMKLNVRNLRKV